MSDGFIIVLAMLFMFFTFLRYYKGAIIWNIFAIGMVVALAIQFVDQTAMLISFVGVILWLAIDTYLGAKA